MAINIDATSAPNTTAWQAGLSAQSWSHTCSGSDRCLLVGVTIYHSAARTVSGITYNGVALTKIAGITAALEGNQQDCELWYLANPTSGTNTITVTLSAAANFWAPLAASYTGVDTAAAIDANNTGQNTSNSTNAPTVSVTTVADNDWLVGFAWSRAGVPSASTGTIDRIRNTGTWCALSDSNGAKSPAGSYNLAWTASSGTWPGVVTAALKPLASTTAKPPFPFFKGIKVI